MGVEESFGTADGVIIAGNELQIHDLKYSKGARVDAEQNEQLQLYALGALEQFSMLYEFETVRLFIHQPRLNHVSERALTVEELQAFAERAQEAAASVIVMFNIADCEGVETLPLENFTPGEKQCRFCKASAICTARQQLHFDTIAGDFVDLTQPTGEQLAEAVKRVPLLTAEQLAEVYSQADFIESWLKAVRDRVNSELNAGHPVPDFKLVTGKQGNRAWSDEEAARALLKDQFRYKMEEVFDFKLISPTKAEKLIKKASPRRWPKVEALITRADGKPTVAPESDPRPALNINPINDFDDVSDDALAAYLICLRNDFMKIKLNNLRLAFPALFEAKTVNGEGDPSFSSVFLMDPKHPQLAEVRKALKQVAKEKREVRSGKPFTASWRKSSTSACMMVTRKPNTKASRVTSS